MTAGQKQMVSMFSTFLITEISFFILTDQQLLGEVVMVLGGSSVLRGKTLTAYYTLVTN